MYIKLKQILLITFDYPKIVVFSSTLFTFLYSIFKFELSIILLVSILVFVDTVLKLMYSYKNKVISSKKFSSLFEKMIVYILLLFSSHLPLIFLTDSLSIIIFTPIQSIILISVVLRELISIIENCVKLNIYIIPKKLAEKLEQYKDEYVN